jgi:hypothetical protein
MQGACAASTVGFSQSAGVGNAGQGAAAGGVTQGARASYVRRTRG